MTEIYQRCHPKDQKYQKLILQTLNLSLCHRAFDKTSSAVTGVCARVNSDQDVKTSFQKRFPFLWA